MMDHFIGLQFIFNGSIILKLINDDEIISLEKAKKCQFRGNS